MANQISELPVSKQLQRQLPDVERISEFVWFALWTNPRCERRAIQSLRDQGLEAYLPLASRYARPARSRNRIWKQVSAPLMPRYVFVGMPRRAINFRVLREADGIAGIVGIGYCPMEIPSYAIFFLRERERAGQFDEDNRERPKRRPVLRGSQQSKIIAIKVGSKTAAVRAPLTRTREFAKMLEQAPKLPVDQIRNVA